MAAEMITSQKVGGQTLVKDLHFICLRAFGNSLTAEYLTFEHHEKNLLALFPSF